MIRGKEGRRRWHFSSPEPAQTEHGPSARQQNIINIQSIIAILHSVHITEVGWSVARHEINCRRLITCQINVTLDGDAGEYLVRLWPDVTKTTPLPSPYPSTQLHSRGHSIAVYGTLDIGSLIMMIPSKTADHARGGHLVPPSCARTQPIHINTQETS